MWGKRQPKTRAQLARIGEHAAARYLQSRGYAILERNYRSQLGEVDIIARHGPDLVFVEVKSRTPQDAFAPADSVTPAKRAKLARLARYYVAARACGEERCRFDVAEVSLNDDGGVVGVRVIAGAFVARG